MSDYENVEYCSLCKCDHDFLFSGSSKRSECGYPEDHVHDIEWLEKQIVWKPADKQDFGKNIPLVKPFVPMWVIMEHLDWLEKQKKEKIQKFHDWLAEHIKGNFYYGKHHNRKDLIELGNNQQMILNRFDKV